jgi:Zn-dependent protease
MPIEQLVMDPIGFLRELLWFLPAVLLALTLHECAHGLVAYWCGDRTAKMMGRLSANPLRHIDPVGMFMMIFAGIGWAKPVPVNPYNFRHGRRDDFLVSIAGVTVNLILFLLSLFGFYAIQVLWANPNGAFYDYLLQFTWTFATLNLSLALFNLLPIPPLDGYHVLNDLLLKRPLFADARAMQIGQGILIIAAITGLLNRILSVGLNFVLNHASDLIFTIFQWLGWIR